MDYFKKIIKESVVIVIISSIMGLISGTFLSINQQILYSFPIILLILPSLNSLIGDISTVLTSRLSSHLYLGNLPPKIQKSNVLRNDFYGLLITILLSLIALIIIGYAVGIATGIQIINPLLIITVIMLTLLILFVMIFILLFTSSIFLFRRGKDPNNFLIPLTTSLLDFLTPLILIFFIYLFT
ncbi:MAG: magnesium transporter [Candidatus Lokiarchaeota archaeon]|nr:magnesium transporter [Candidatus Lokiarchaeota archaeon]